MFILRALIVSSFALYAWPVHAQWRNVEYSDLSDTQFRSGNNYSTQLSLDFDRDKTDDVIKMMKNHKLKKFGIFFCKGSKNKGTMSYKCPMKPFFDGPIANLANFAIGSPGRPSLCPVKPKHCFDGYVIESSAAIFWWENGPKYKWYSD